MKRTSLIFAIAAAIALFFSACNNEKHEQEKKQLQEQKDSLQLIIDHQAQEVNDFINSFLEIQESLNVIKEKESLITINSGDGAEITANPDIRESIQQDIRDIYQLLLNNKQKVQDLRNSLQKSNNQVSKYEALVKNLEEQIETRDKEINNLKEELGRKNLQIAGLEEVINAMSNTVLGLNATIGEQVSEMNTAYFRMATKKTLQADGIITKKGDVVPEMNPMFQVVDITTFTEIPIFASKAEIITSHPTESYEIIGDKKQVEKMIIKDPQAFWSVQKFLIIQVKY